MRLTDFRVVVFDLDDTLILERDYVESGFRAVARHLSEAEGWPAPRAENFRAACIKMFTDGHRGNTFDRALRITGDGLPTPSIADLVSSYRTHLPDISLQPDAIETLQQLTRLGHDVWVITDGPLQSQTRKVEATGLTKWTDQIVYTDNWGRAFWKPQPRAFQHVQEATDREPSQHIYVADNPAKDFIGPTELGWGTARIRRVGGLYAELPDLPESAPLKTVESLLEL